MELQNFWGSFCAAVFGFSWCVPVELSEGVSKQLVTSGGRWRTTPPDDEMLWLLSFLLNHCWQDPTPCVDEPVAQLHHGEAGTFCQCQLFGIVGVGVVPVVKQPTSQNSFGLPVKHSGLIVLSLSGDG